MDSMLAMKLGYFDDVGSVRRFLGRCGGDLSNPMLARFVCSSYTR